jgi:mannose-6-phosphate isomerase
MESPKLYPLKFKPLYKYRIWGGEKLKSTLNKKYDDSNIGESWEISNVKNDETLVKDGDLKGMSLQELIETFTSDFLGAHVYNSFGTNFPLLIKYIDAKTPLSIQVHPSDELAKERHNAIGKNEMWYIMDAEEEAEIIVGFNKEVSKEDYQESLKTSSITSILNKEKVAKGDVFNIPTGRVHAIGAGVLLAEIQQTSDVTYRIYDYDRVDSKTGKLRDLHTELALDAIDFEVKDSYKTDYTLEENKSSKLIHSPYFKTNILAMNGSLKRDFSNLDSFVILMSVEGSFIVTHKEYNYSIKYGETLLIPACITDIEIDGKGKLLEVNL